MIAPQLSPFSEEVQTTPARIPGVLCAVDLGPLTGRVLLHGAALARLFGTGLHIVHVTSDLSETNRRLVTNRCLGTAPYEVSIRPDDIIVRRGRVSEVIQREAARIGGALVVMGSRKRHGLTQILLGSTSKLVLRNLASPVLLVPPDDVDIVSLSDRVSLTTGAVLAAIDLDGPCDQLLALAGGLAELGRQPLIVMTVARKAVSDEVAAGSLRDRCHWLSPVRPHSYIVRRGNVATEIAHCAATENAGLVVMGLRGRKAQRPGAIAAAVLAACSAFVLAVPERSEEQP